MDTPNPIPGVPAPQPQPSQPVAPTAPPQVQVHIDAQPPVTPPPTPTAGATYSLTPQTPTPVSGMDPEKKKLIKKIAIGVAVVVLGASAYFLSSGGLFQGRLRLQQDIDNATAELEKLGDSIELINDMENHHIWPPQAGGDVAFRANEDLILEMGGQDTLKWIKADFSYEDNNGEVTFVNTSETFGAQVGTTCFKFEPEQEKQCFQRGMPITHRYENAGDYEVEMETQEGVLTWDGVVKTVTVGPIGPTAAPDFTFNEIEPFRAEFSVANIAALLEDPRYDNATDWCFVYGDPNPDAIHEHCEQSRNINRELVVEHNYQVAGSYTVNLELRNSNDDSIVALSGTEIQVTGNVRQPAQPQPPQEPEVPAVIPPEGDEENADGLRIEIVNADTIRVIDTASQDIENLAYTNLRCAPGYSLAGYYVSEPNEIYYPRSISDIRTEGYLCNYHTGPGTYTLTYDYIAQDRTILGGVTREVTVPFDFVDDGIIRIGIAPELEISPEDNGIIIARDITESYPDGANQTRLYCGDGNAEMARFYIGASQPAEGRFAGSSEIMKTEGFECPYSEDGDFTISYSFNENDNELGSISMPVTVNHGVDGVEPAVEPEAPAEQAAQADIGVALNVNVDPVAMKALVSDTTATTNNIAYVSLQCKEGGEKRLFVQSLGEVAYYDVKRAGGYVTSGENGGFDYNSVQNAFATFRGDGFACAYEAPGTYAISYKIYDINSNEIGTLNQNVVVEIPEVSFVQGLAKSLFASVLSDSLYTDVFNASPNAKRIPAGASVYIEFACSTEESSFTIATTTDSPKVGVFKVIAADRCEASVEEEVEVQIAPPVQIGDAPSFIVNIDGRKGRYIVAADVIAQYPDVAKWCFDAGDGWHELCQNTNELRPNFDYANVYQNVGTYNVSLKLCDAEDRLLGQHDESVEITGDRHDPEPQIGVAQSIVREGQQQQAPVEEPNPAVDPEDPADEPDAAGEPDPVDEPEVQGQPTPDAPISRGGGGSSSGGGGGRSTTNQLKAICDISSTNPVVGQTVAFGASSSTGKVAAGSWNFDDGTDSLYEFDVSAGDQVDVEYIFESPGVRNVTLTVTDGEKRSQCDEKITVDVAKPAAACFDKQDNDGDGFSDLDDPGCEGAEDNDETNGFSRGTPECNDGQDNDADGFSDLDDIGCQNAFDKSEGNPEEKILFGGETAQQVCLKKSDKTISFADIDSNYAQDLILDFATGWYDGNDVNLKGDMVVRGYQVPSGYEFRGDQPIRRDEALKLLSLTSCLTDLSETAETDQNFEYKDAEFSDPDYWAREIVYNAASHGLIKKAPYMYPDSNVTRGEFAKMLANVDKNLRGTSIARCEKDEQLAGDLDFTQWSCNYFKTLGQLGIVEPANDGKGNTRLYPNEMLDRTSAIVWLNNYIAVINK